MEKKLTSQFDNCLKIVDKQKLNSAPILKSLKEVDVCQSVHESNSIQLRCQKEGGVSSPLNLIAWG